jgi:2-aminoadipate transaminase
MNPTQHPFTLARRAERMNPSIIREILKVTERPGIVSLAGGLPSADTFPVQAVRDATERVLRESPREALQYAASEGFAPLREWVAEGGLVCTRLRPVDLGGLHLLLAVAATEQAAVAA